MSNEGDVILSLIVVESRNNLLSNKTVGQLAKFPFAQEWGGKGRRELFFSVLFVSIGQVNCSQFTSSCGSLLSVIRCSSLQATFFTVLCCVVLLQVWSADGCSRVVDLKISEIHEDVIANR